MFKKVWLCKDILAFEKMRLLKGRARIHSDGVVFKMMGLRLKKRGCVRMGGSH